MIKIELPGSKSIAARALVCRLLSGHDTRMGNLPDCTDTRGMLRLTAGVRQAAGDGRPVDVEIGEGGTTLRFGMAACASTGGLDIMLRCSGRLMQRPHAELIAALRHMGAEIEELSGGFHIRGKKLSGGEMEMSGETSSQFISAVMLAAPVWKRDTLIRVAPPVVSLPYIEMTAGVMRAFGAYAEIENTDEGGCLIRIRATGYPECAAYDVEGDWSASSYIFETKLILEAIGREMPDISMPTLHAPVESLQGDSRIAGIYAEARKALGDSSSIRLNMADAPDLVPALAVGFCLSGIRFRIEGIAHLRHKESDRMAALQSELWRLGHLVKTGEDWMEYSGDRCGCEENPYIRTYGDHRMAMAFACAALVHPDIRIENPSVVDKSFPGFWNEIKKLIPSVRI